jgi:CBS domain-containing protein
MKISDVLAGKGNRVVSVRPGKSVAELPGLFDEHSISSVPVVDATGRLLGIVTDRLFMKALARYGTAMLEFTAADVMQTPAPSCMVDDTVAHAMRLMTEQRVRHLVVLQESAMVGLVSIGDLVKWRLQDVELESRVLREIALGHLAAE